MGDSSDRQHLPGNDPVTRSTLEALQAVYSASLAVLIDQVRGGLELPEDAALRIAKAIKERSRTAIGTAVGKAYHAGRHFDATQEEHEAPTRRITQTFEKPKP